MKPIWHPEYVEYQTRYREQPRESDRRLIELLAAAVGEIEQPAIVDVGCSTGNLLRHIRSALPHARLSGGDVAPDAVAVCQSDTSLDGISFSLLDVMALPASLYDAVIVNAVLYQFDEEKFVRALASAHKALLPGGALISFEFYHPFKQELEIREVSESHPGGASLHFRSMPRVSEQLQQAGFVAADFHPFRIPIDLPKDVSYGSNASGYESLNSFTERLETGERVIFRGALAQPWCHVVARKAGLPPE